MSKKFNSVFKSMHDDMLKSLRNTLMLMGTPIVSWAFYLRTGMTVSYYLTMILLIPAVVFFWIFLRDTGRVITYYKFYSPYGEDTPHAQGKKKLSKRQRQRLKAKEAEVQ